MRIRWTPLALNDLKIISLHTERQRNLATANRVCRIIYDTVQILRRFAESGKPGIEEGTREFVVPKMPIYTVAYRINRSRIASLYEYSPVYCVWLPISSTSARRRCPYSVEPGCG
jgi:plasmid stabilization system protein ParE